MLDDLDLRVQQGDQGGGDVGDAVDDQEIAGLVDEVEAIIQVGRQRLQVLAVERRDERGVDALNDRVVQFVAAVLDLVELIAQGDALFGGGSIDVRQDLDGLLKLAGLRGEVFKKVRALGLVSESHGVFGPSNGERHCCATCNRPSWGGQTSSSDALLLHQ